MASKSNIKVLSFSKRNMDNFSVPKKASEVIAPGDPIEVNSGSAEVVDSADNSVFLGISAQGSEAADTRDISVYGVCVVKALLVGTSDAVVFGDAVKYSAGANGTAWSFTKDTADGIMWALESISAGSYGKFLVNYNLLKGAALLFDVVSN